MSKRARITLNPDMEAPSEHDAAARKVSEQAVPSAPRQGSAAPEGSATVVTAERTLNTGVVIKVVLMGLAVVAAVLIFKGRKI